MFEDKILVKWWHYQIIKDEFAKFEHEESINDQKDQFYTNSQIKWNQYIQLITIKNLLGQIENQKKKTIRYQKILNFKEIQHIMIIILDGMLIQFLQNKKQYSQIL